MVIMSQNKEDKNLDTQRFSERMSGFSTAKNIMTDASVGDLKTLKIPAMSITILELKK